VIGFPNAAVVTTVFQIKNTMADTSAVMLGIKGSADQG